MPPESWSGNWLPESSSPTSRSTCSALRTRSAFGPPWISSPNATLSTTWPKAAAVSATAVTALPYPGIRRAPRPAPGSKQPHGLAVLVDVDVEGGRIGPVAGHRLHVAAERDDPAGARIGPKVTDGDGE